MQISPNPSWMSRYAACAAELPIDGRSGAAQAAALWRAPGGRSRVPGAPSRAILARAEEVSDMLRRLKVDVAEPDNATKAARLSLLA